MIKKIVVILPVGLLLCFAFIELGLYGVGCLFKVSQERLNNASLLESENSYRILCYGDSTTAIGGKDAWPGQLEQVLSDRNPGKTFCVINRGVVLIDTAGIRDSLEEDLDEFDPHMVIIMAGLNDVKKDLSGSMLNTIKQALHIFRTYRLAEQFWPNTFHPSPIDYDHTEKAYKAPDTIDNFRTMRNLLDARDTRLVIMQYPLRALMPLKEIFDPGDDILFVDNESLFKEALMKGHFDDFFVDRFAGDFGHCSKKGNRMIAENVAQNVAKVIKSDISTAFQGPVLVRPWCKILQRYDAPSQTEPLINCMISNGFFDRHFRQKGRSICTMIPY